jgi:hypothetical protein
VPHVSPPEPLGVGAFAAQGTLQRRKRQKEDTGAASAEAKLSTTLRSQGSFLTVTFSLQLVLAPLSYSLSAHFLLYAKTSVWRSSGYPNFLLCYDRSTIEVNHMPEGGAG